ncbi:MAG: FAD-dependent oxidoreductase [Bacteroidetes bacterium]|nr:MAG: FAD-dependent oxidoreductase [Bacteroidota bacterium]
MKTYDFLILGAGIFGLSTALSLLRRGYSVGILNPEGIPHPLAASTDISKVVRMEYGSDEEYMAMAEASLQGWHAWNDLFGDTLYHETGYLITSSQPLEAAPHSYEATSYRLLLQKGYQPERLKGSSLGRRFPAFAAAPYVDGFFHAKGGFAESGRVVSTLARYARQLGADLHQGHAAASILTTKGRVTGVRSREGGHFAAGQVVVCAGNFTPYLLPELQPFMRVSGHPVFHLKPSRPDLFTPPQFAVFAADIARSGWYGFPLHPSEGVVKIANHGAGLTLHPENDPRLVTAQDEAHLRAFLAQSLPALQHDPIVYTRRCCYTDTLDGHFWIDRHPEIKGLSVGSGGSGHGFKMGPVIGELIAAAALGEVHPWSARYRWRQLDEHTLQHEQARFLANRKL